MGVFGGNYEAAGLVGFLSADYVGHLCACVGGGDDGATAGEHAGELGGHDEVGDSGSLGKEVDVGGVQEVVEAIEWLEGEEGYVGAVGYERLELRTEGPVTAEEEVDARVMLEGSGEGGEKLEALLGSHVAGVEEESFAVEIEFAAIGVGGGAGLGLYRFDVDPVGEEGSVRCRDALSDGSLDHLAGDAGDSSKGLGEEFFEAEGEGVDGAFGGEEIEVEGGVYLEVLHMEPGGGSGGLCCEEGDWGAEEGGFDGEDDLRLPEELACDDGKAAEHEGGEMEDAFEAGGAGGDEERSAVDGGLGGIFSGGVFGAIEGVAVVFSDAPCRIVRGSGDHADFVASSG